MQKLLVITVMMAFATPGCLDGFKESFVSCDNITGECKYEILRGNEYSRLHIEVNYVTGNAPDPMHGSQMEMFSKRLSINLL